MRLDKFLKVSRIIKRRTIANEACDKGLVSANGRTVKASYIVKVGDEISVTFGNRSVRFLVRALNNHVNKADAESMYEVLE